MTDKKRRSQSRRTFLKQMGLAGLGMTTLSLKSALPAWAFDNKTAVYLNPHAPLEKRVTDLFGRLTQEDKLGLLGGTGFATRAISHLQVPPMSMADAPQGVRGGEDGTIGNATLFPDGIAMASTWDPEMVERIGMALGAETRGKGTGADILLGPCVNIHRSPLGGRNTESYSEDPFLAGQIATAYVRGVQSQGTAACVKHFACNNEEVDRGFVDVQVSERALREIYTPAFRAAVQQGKVWAVMSSYNQVNGHHSSANPHLLTDILKHDWGFDGIVMSDWGGVHETVGTVNAGNDLEMPNDDFLTASKVAAALAAGEIQQSAIDDSARRIVRTLIRTKLLDGPKIRNHTVVNSEAHRQVAYEAATKAVVLLKNESSALPLERSKIKSLAVIGPHAAKQVLGGGGSATVIPVSAVSPLDGLKKLGGPNIVINYAEGTSLNGDLPVIPASAFPQGLQGVYFSNTTLDGTPGTVQTSDHIDFDWKSGSPASGIPANNWSARWTGSLTAPKTGTYTLGLTSDDGSRLYINDKLLIDNWGDHASTLQTAEMDLTAGQSYPIRIEYYQALGEATLQFGWRVPDAQTDFPEAVAAATQSDAAIIFGGISEQFEGEGQDRSSMSLPGEQNALIKAVVQANPRTIVVLYSGTPNLMSEWIDQVPAILQAWYPGEDGGHAIAALLFGDVNPSGKLTDTFALKREDYPDFGNFPGTNGVVHYAEGIYVGYRHFDKHQITPQYPFGHGLSYTTFAYSSPRIPDTLTHGHKAQVQATVRNTGKRFGEEVAQLYIRPIHPTIDRPIRELKGFAKVGLKPGESKTVSFPLDESSFAYYDEDNSRWQTDPGSYAVEIGASSRDLKLVGTIVVK